MTQLIDNLTQLKQQSAMKADDAAAMQRVAEEMRRANEETRRAAEVVGRIAAMARTVCGEEEDTDPTPERKAALDRDKDALKKLLSSQFDDRQKAQTEELRQLRQRLDKLEKEINDRAQNRDEIIKHRLEALTSSTATTPNSSSQPVMVFTTPNLTLKNGSDSVPVQIETGSPGTLTITRPAAPQSPSADSTPADDAK
jgi:hypothetical protein